MRRIARCDRQRTGAFTFARMNIVIASVIVRAPPPVLRIFLSLSLPCVRVGCAFTAMQPEKSTRIDAKIQRAIISASHFYRFR
jgi:hypothetical protein